jgi:hypothetical protein
MDALASASAWEAMVRAIRNTFSCPAKRVSSAAQRARGRTP